MYPVYVFLILPCVATKTIFFEAVCPPSHKANHESIPIMKSKPGGKLFASPFFLNCDHDNDFENILKLNADGANARGTRRTDQDHCNTVRDKGGDCIENGAILKSGTGDESVAMVSGEFEISSTWAAKTDDQCTVSVDAEDVGGGVHASALFTCDWTASNAVVCNFKGDGHKFDRRIRCQCTKVPVDDNGDPNPVCDCLEGLCLLGVCDCAPGRSGRQCGLDRVWSSYTSCKCSTDSERSYCVQLEAEAAKGGKPCPERTLKTRSCQISNLDDLPECPSNLVPPFLGSSVPQPQLPVLMLALFAAGALLMVIASLILIYVFCCAKKEVERPSKDSVNMELGKSVLSDASRISMMSTMSELPMPKKTSRPERPAAPVRSAIPERSMPGRSAIPERSTPEWAAKPERLGTGRPARPEKSAIRPETHWRRYTHEGPARKSPGWATSRIPAATEHTATPGFTEMQARAWVAMQKQSRT